MTKLKNFMAILAFVFLIGIIGGMDHGSNQQRKEECKAL